MADDLRTKEIQSRIFDSLRSKWPEHPNLKIFREIGFRRINVINSLDIRRSLQNALSIYAGYTVEAVLSDLAASGYRITEATVQKAIDMAVEMMATEGTSPVDGEALRDSLEASIPAQDNRWGGALHGPHPPSDRWGDDPHGPHPESFSPSDAGDGDTGNGDGGSQQGGQEGATRSGDAGDGTRGGGGSQEGGHEGATRGGDAGDGTRGGGSGGGSGGNGGGGSQEGGREGATRGGDAGDGTRGGGSGGSGGGSGGGGGGGGNGGGGGGNGGSGGGGGGSGGSGGGGGGSGGSGGSGGGGGGGGKPIVLDLDGDGVELVALDESTAFYDINGDGYRYNLGWAGADDGLLAYDKDGDGDIADRDEISFVGYVEGARTDLEGLHHFDTDGDGSLTSSDAEFGKFRVWQDLDQDGRSDAGELRTLAEAGIESIDLDYAPGDDGRTEEVSGNRIFGEGEYVHVDGDGDRRTGTFADVGVAVGRVGHKTDEAGHLLLRTVGGEAVRLYDFSGSADQVRIVFTDSGHADAIGALAGSGGSVLDGSGVERALLLLGGSGADLLSGGAGDDWLKGGAGADELRGGAGHDVLFFDAADTVVEGGAGFDAGFAATDENVTVNAEQSGLEAVFGAGGDDTLEGSSGLNVLSGGGGADTLRGHGGDDTLKGGDGDDTLEGGEGSDFLHGGGGSDSLDGGAGSDLYMYVRGDGRDTIDDAGGGADVLYLAGITLLDLAFRKDGDDLQIGIKEAGAASVATAAEFDALEGRIAIEGWFNAEDVNQVEFLMFEDGTVLDLKEWVAGHGLGNAGVHDLKERMGTAAAAIAAVPAEHAGIVGTDAAEQFGGDGGALDRVVHAKGGDDILYVDEGDDFYGGEGWDTVVFTDDAARTVDLHAHSVERVYGGGGDDRFEIAANVASASLHLYGGGGNDELIGGAAADRLHGGAGDDALKGGERDDVYLFARGDGKDTIDDDRAGLSKAQIGNDTLFLGAGIALSDLVFRMVGDDLQIGVKDGADAGSVSDAPGFEALGDRITIKGWNDPKRRIENLVLMDGTAVDLEHWVSAYGLADGNVRDLGALMAASPGVPVGAQRPVVGTDLGEALSGIEGADRIDAKGGDDTVYAVVRGAGRYDGGAGSDTLSFVASPIGVAADLSQETVSREPLEGETGPRISDSIVGFEHLEGSSHDDSLLGSAGGNRLEGGGGADVLDGKGGNDELAGGLGNDLYLYRAGDGHDAIEDSGGERDAVRMESASLGDLSFVQAQDSLELRFSGGSITVAGHFDGTAFGKGRIELLEFSDGLWLNAEEFMSAEIKRTELAGTSANDSLHGETALGDLFDADAGGNDRLHGAGGNDIYWLGAGTGNDVVREHYNNTDGDDGDAIRIKAGIAPSSVRLRRSDNGDHLHVQLLDADNAVTDSLKVENHYTDATAKIESVEFADGTVWNAADLMAARIVGTSGNDSLYGESSLDDVFDAGAGGNDRLHGYGGNDVYWLGAGTGDDIVREHYNNTDGDDGDAIRIKAGIDPSSVRLRRSDNGDHLHVQLLDAAGAVTDSLKVENHYTDDTAKVESVVFDDGTVWDAADFADAGIVGTSRNDSLHGEAGLDDVFDADAGGNDRLHGYGGNDVYWLGTGTGDDIVREHYHNADGDAGDAIRIKAGIDPSSVRLRRSDDGNHLHVQLLDAASAVTDSLKVENHYTDATAKVESVVFDDGTVWGAADFAAARIVGTSGNDTLHGESDLDDVFDADAGGNDRLHGYGGNDVYWLGAGTGNDVVREHYHNADGDAGDAIRIKAGIDPSSVRLRRSDDGNHLHVQLLDAASAVTDSLKVENHYTDATAKVESVVFDDGTVWGAADFAAARIVGTSGNDTLHGEADLDDVFDADAGGNDRLHGYGGNDVYWLGAGTGNDVVREHYHNADGDAGDVIRIKAGIDPSSVRLRRSDDGNHLHVQLLAADNAVTDSLKVESHYTDDTAKVESVVFDDGTVWDAADFAAARIVGTSGNDTLHGESDLDDVFDADAGGNDRLHGYGGDDVYWLGTGTGNDVVREHYHNADGDAGDVIRIKAGIAPSSVRLRRSDDGNHLHVQLLDAASAVTDSLKVESHYTDATAKVESVVFDDGTVWGAADFAAARIVGTSRNDTLHGESDLDDVFDADAGGNDRLHGYGGDDVYWLGAGTGNDVVREHYHNADGDAGDAIRIKAGIGPSSVRLRRSDNGDHLHVQLLDSDNAVADSLKVENHYTDDTAKVESIVFDDGTVWDAADFADARIVGTSRNDSLHGESGLDDVFDGDAGGNDRLYGYSGNDVYWLGAGTGNDEIHEHYSNTDGDGGDAIRAKDGIGTSAIRLERQGNHLLVKLAGQDGAVTDSLKVVNHFSDDTAKVERIEAAGQVLLARDYSSLINEIAAFNSGDSSFADMNTLLGNYWQDENALTAPSS